MDWMTICAAAALVAVLALGIFLWHLHSLELPQNRQLRQPAPRIGIWFCAHRARRWIPFQHMYLKITPRDPSWAARYPDIFKNTDSNGAAFCSLGAGPSEARMLRLEFNRHFDLEDPVSFEEQVRLQSIEQENGCIASVLASAASYRGDLEFTTLHGLMGHGYNCNSMMAAVAERSGFGLPGFSGVTLLCIGAGNPVPGEHFKGKLSSG